MKITRRALMQAAAVAPAVAAQTPPAPPDLLAAAREQVKRSGDRLAKIAMPMATEPAFSFKP
ncbi:MAG: twin-arginine translocation signal domain-containing protein [Acidobacteriota bacterium]|nr:twin-arginine translocation signal domain-containing protein [Acidobacteriota bacterium]